MNLYPAIDLLGGKVVRLRQGAYDDSTVYGDDPVAVAESFVVQGATWVHMVDLDAAKSAEPVNRPIIAAVAKALAGRAQLQVGGGVRGTADAEALAIAGVNRVVMGSAAVADPSLVSVVARIVPVAVGLDHRDGIAATHGWTESSGLRVEDLLSQFPDAAAFVITDISRDGMLTGPDVEGLARAVASTRIPVVASGGVGTLAHIEELAKVRKNYMQLQVRVCFGVFFTVETKLCKVVDIVE
jgi:phosphoribosylformimino-5-aminoimidazole carboxamide ribotide isomerase